MLNSLLHPLLSLSGWEGYLLVAALCFGEAAVFLGFVLPGETAVVYGGVLASEHHLSIIPLCVIVVCCAIAGDTVGYAVGRLFGPRLLQIKLLQRHAGVDKTRAFVARRGAMAVFFGRFTAVFRALVPGIAGASGVPYWTFALANAAGGLCWGLCFTLAGYYVGQKVLSAGTTVSTVILSLAAVALIALEVRRRLKDRAERRRPPGPAAPVAGAPDAPGAPATPAPAPDAAAVPGTGPGERSGTGAGPGSEGRP